MATVVKKVAYLAVDVPNKPGEGAGLLATLAGAGVNLLAFTGFPSGRKAQLDIVPENVAACRKALRTAKIKTRPQKFGFLVQGDDKNGAVAALLGKLGKEKINVTAIDAVSAGNGRYGAILWVNSRDLNKAAKVLKAK